jgi:phage terminase small subunit
MRGRPTKPTALKILQGNPGGRPLPENEPIPPDGEVEKPEGMSAPAGAMWDRYAPMIEEMGLLTVADVPAFAFLCALMAEADFDPRGMAAARITRMEALWSKFGMDPSSRARLGSVGKKAKKNPFEELTG